MKKFFLVMMISALSLISALASSYEPIPGSPEKKYIAQGYSVVSCNETITQPVKVNMKDGSTCLMPLIKRCVSFEKTQSEKKKVEIVFYYCKVEKSNTYYIVNANNNISEVKNEEETGKTDEKNENEADTGSEDSYQPIPKSKESSLINQGFNVIQMNERDLGAVRVATVNGKTESLPIIKRWVRLEQDLGDGGNVANSNPVTTNLGGGWSMLEVTDNNKRIVELVIYYTKDDATGKCLPVNLK
jgi:hypothetical protein